MGVGRMRSHNLPPKENLHRLWDPHPPPGGGDHSDFYLYFFQVPILAPRYRPPVAPHPLVAVNSPNPPFPEFEQKPGPSLHPLATWRLSPLPRTPTPHFIVPPSHSSLATVRLQPNPRFRMYEMLVLMQAPQPPPNTSPALLKIQLCFFGKTRKEECSPG